MSLVTVETTAGTLTLELAPDAAPRTVENFLAYVREGYYAGTVFHRVVPGFVVQGGGYLANGARKKPTRPPVPLEVGQGLRHVDRALAMARLPDDRHSATTEFYVCDGAQPELDGDYAVFGRVASGWDAVARMLGAPRDASDRPKEPAVIVRAYEGAPDPANPTPKWTGAAADAAADADAVRVAARRLRGRAALLRARKPMMAMGDVEDAITRADRTGRREDLEDAERRLRVKEGKP